MERALGIELRKLSNLTCRYFDQQTNKRAVDAVTGTNGWIISRGAKRKGARFISATWKLALASRAPQPPRWWR